MTEKRYYVVHDNTDGIDKVRDRYTHSYMSADDICDKLNELEELER